MGYSKEIFEQTEQELERRRRAAEQKAEAAARAFYDANPGARLIKNQMASTGARVAIAVAKGGNAKQNLEKLRDENLALQTELNRILAENGLTKADITPQYTCKKCNDTGYIDGFRCECMKNLLRMAAFDKLNKVTPLKISTFESFNINFCRDERGQIDQEMVKNLRNCKDFADNFSTDAGGIFMYGNTGLGKTHLSLAIAGEVINKGYGVVYGSAYSFVNNFERERFSDDSEDTSSSLIDADLLIIDDLGAENMTKYTLAVLYNVIDTRMMSSKPVIISSNLNLSQIAKDYGQRFASRILSSMRIMKFDGTDYRVANRRAPKIDRG